MGFQNIEGYGTFGKMNRQRVIGFLKNAGTRDSDVLFLYKQKLIAPNKNLKFVGYALIAFGAVFTVTVILAIVGIPLMILGVWLWWFTRRNISVVEAAYSEYLASQPA